jgi:hypothetical protein
VPIETVDTLRGKTPSTGIRRNRVYAGDRVCSVRDCETRLSVYNASDECWQHTEVKPFVLQVPRRRRSRSAPEAPDLPAPPRV